MGSRQNRPFILTCVLIATVLLLFAIRVINQHEHQHDTINDQDSVTVFVSKTDSLSADYVPADLVTCNVRAVKEATAEERKLRRAAASALESMFAEAEGEGVILYVESGYRSYAHQTATYNSVKKASGEEYANQYVAQPGHSEHQTGLAMDITNIDHMDDANDHGLGSTKEGIWLRDNAHRFGFILRYPEDKTGVTGYSYEPWHFRYVGVDTATEIYQKGMTFDEYIEGKS